MKEMRFYGPSNITSMQLPSGRRCEFRKATTRLAMADYGDNERSLPFIDTNDPVEIAFLKKELWTLDPKMVRKTPAERAVIEQAREEGSVTLQLLTKSLAEQAVKQAANSK